MIEIIALIILLVFVAILIFTFLSYASFLLNLILLIALFFLIKKDLKDKDNHKYYIASLLLTAIFFILSTTGFVRNFLVLTSKMLLSTAIVSVIVLYIFAHLIALIYESLHYLKEKKNENKASK